MEDQLFCDTNSQDFRNRVLVLKKYNIDICILPEEVLDLLFFKSYEEEELWYLLCSLNAAGFEVEDIYTFLRDAEFDADCHDLLDSYTRADEEFLSQMKDSCYYSFKDKNWKNEISLVDAMALPSLERSESVSQVKHE